jgi:acyl-CoA thioester hydrolase
MISLPKPTTIDWYKAHRWPIRVYYEDTDAGGVVFYANYLKFMERARTEWLRTLEINQQDLALAQSVIFVVSQLDMKYKLPARLDDALFVETVVTYVGRASMTFTQRVMRHSNVLALGDIRVGCLDTRSFKPTALPVDIRKHVSLLTKR